MNRISEGVAMLRAGLAEARDPLTDKDALKASCADMLDGKSENDGGCHVQNRLCDHGWITWRNRHGSMQAQKCECGRVDTRNVSW